MEEGKLWDRIADLLAMGEPLVLATIIEKTGSAPRDRGTSMAVLPDGTPLGTLGGGSLEKGVVRLACLVHLEKGAAKERFFLEGQEESGRGFGGFVEVLLYYVDPGDPALREVFSELSRARQEGSLAWLIVSFSEKGPPVGIGLLTERLFGGSLPGECRQEMPLRRACRRREAVRLQAGSSFFIVFPAGRPETVFLFGAGHVAQALASICGLIDLRVVVIDDRRELATAERFPAAAEIRIVRDPAAEIPRLRLAEDAYVVIMTHSHSQDGAILAAALKTRARYIGMISSRRKKEIIFEALSGQGVSGEQLRRVRSPVGLDIGGRTPGEIAVSIAAEIIAVRAGRIP